MSVSMVTRSTVNIGTEAVVISNIGHGSPSTIRLLEGVFSLDIFTITLLRSLLHIPSVVVVDSIRVLVARVSL